MQKVDAIITMNFRAIPYKGLFFPFIGLVLLGNASFGQPANWKGIIREENGIRVIENPEEPIHGEINLQLQEELSIGSGNAREYAFYKGVGILVDCKENIYALDYANLRIQKYDKKGNYVQTVGGKGQGPGEFQYIGWAFLDTEGNLYASQLRSISVFDIQGKFVKSIPLSCQIGPFYITRDKDIITSSLAYGADNIKSNILIIGPDGKIRKKVASFTMKKLNVTRDIPVGASNPFTPVLFFRPQSEERSVYGFSAEYKLFVIDNTGRIVCIIDKKESPRSLTKEDKDQAIEREFDFLRSRRFNISITDIKKAYNFPAHRPFFSGMLIDDKGNIYLLKLDEGNGKTKECCYDIFSKDGYYLYRVVTDKKIFPQAIANNCIYASHEDEEGGYFEINRYRIKNWK